jgi:putative FmdB family regulatory protein
MPTYEYKCFACDHTFEQFQSITAAPIKRCPQCGKSKVKRLLGTGAGLIFKGSGFYITDYRSESYKNAAKSESGSSGSSGGGESKSTGDTKPSGDGKSSSAKPDSPAPPKAEPKPAKKSKEK